MFKRIISIILGVCFLTGSLMPASYAKAVMPLPAAAGPSIATPMSVPVLKGIRIDVNDPLRMDFILDPGGSPAREDRGPQADDGEAVRLIRYFLTGLTIPGKDLWVNLSPYEKGRIIPDKFGQTQMGRDLLEQDYTLKQMTAALLSPDGDAGRRFWDRVYAQARERYGTVDIPVDAFNKVWIVPDVSEVYERQLDASRVVAYIARSSLKVMLEADHLAQSYQAASVDEMTFVKEILREVVVPALEKEVNEGQDFAVLRQVYQSLILSAWYKKKITKSLLSAVYVDRHKIGGMTTDDPQMSQKIWARYAKIFSKGAQGLIREERDPLSGEMVPRKYFVGGMRIDPDAVRVDQIDVTQQPQGQRIIQVEWNDVPDDAKPLQKHALFLKGSWQQICQINGLLPLLLSALLTAKDDAKKEMNKQFRRVLQHMPQAVTLLPRMKDAFFLDLLHPVDDVRREALLTLEQMLGIDPGLSDQMLAWVRRHLSDDNLNQDRQSGMLLIEVLARHRPEVLTADLFQMVVEEWYHAEQGAHKAIVLNTLSSMLAQRPEMVSQAADLDDVLIHALSDRYKTTQELGMRLLPHRIAADADRAPGRWEALAVAGVFSMDSRLSAGISFQILELLSKEFWEGMTDPEKVIDRLSGYFLSGKKDVGGRMILPFLTTIFRTRGHLMQKHMPALLKAALAGLKGVHEDGARQDLMDLFKFAAEENGDLFDSFKEELMAYALKVIEGDKTFAKDRSALLRVLLDKRPEWFVRDDFDPGKLILMTNSSYPREQRAAALSVLRYLLGRDQGIFAFLRDEFMLFVQAGIDRDPIVAEIGLGIVADMIDLDPGSLVRHQITAFVIERTRQGYDLPKRRLFMQCLTDIVHKHPGDVRFSRKDMELLFSNLGDDDDVIRQQATEILRSRIDQDPDIRPELERLWADRRGSFGAVNKGAGISQAFFLQIRSVIDIADGMLGSPHGLNQFLLDRSGPHVQRHVRLAAVRSMEFLVSRRILGPAHIVPWGEVIPQMIREARDPELAQAVIGLAGQILMSYGDDKGLQDMVSFLGSSEGLGSEGALMSEGLIGLMGLAYMPLEGSKNLWPRMDRIDAQARGNLLVAAAAYYRAGLGEKFFLLWEEMRGNNGLFKIELWQDIFLAESGMKRPSDISISWHAIRELLQEAIQYPFVKEHIMRKIIVMLRLLRQGVRRQGRVEAHVEEFFLVDIRERLFMALDGLPLEIRRMLVRVFPSLDKDEVFELRDAATDLYRASEYFLSRKGLTYKMMKMIHNTPSSQDIEMVKAYHRFVLSGGTKGIAALKNFDLPVTAGDVAAVIARRKKILAVIERLEDALRMVYTGGSLKYLSSSLKALQDIIAPEERSAFELLLDPAFSEKNVGVDGLRSVTELRRYLHRLSRSMPHRDEYLVLRADLKLEMLVYKIFNTLAADHRRLPSVLLLLLENARLNGHEVPGADDLMEEIEEVSSWPQGRNRDMRIYSLIARLERRIRDISSHVSDAYQGVVKDFMQGDVAGKQEVIDNFSANMFREDTVYLLSVAVGEWGSFLRKEMKMGNWQVVAEGQVSGVLRYISPGQSLSQVNAGDILVMDELPEKDPVLSRVGGIIVFNEDSLLSHPAILARQNGIPFVVAFDRENVLRFSRMKIVLRAHGDSVDLREATADVPSDAVAPRIIDVPEADENGPDIVLPEAYTPQTVGLKAFNLRKTDAIRLAAGKKAARHLALSFALAKYPALLHKKIPEISLAIRAVIPDGLVFLRSSTNAEDLRGYSGAGLYDSYGAVDPDDHQQLEMYIRKIWASIDNPRARADRERNRIDDSRVKMAVPVHEMVIAGYSYVVHTFDPIGKTGDRMILEIVQGFGESLVSGDADYKGTAHRFSFDRRTGEVERLGYANKDHRLVFKDGKLQREMADYRNDIFAGQDVPAIVREIFTGAMNLEKGLGGQGWDIEGCLTDDEALEDIFVQARPQQGFDEGAWEGDPDPVVLSKEPGGKQKTDKAMNIFQDRFNAFFGAPRLIQAHELQLYFDADAMARVAGRKFYVRKLLPGADMKFIMQWKEDLKKDLAWQKAWEEKDRYTDRVPFFEVFSDTSIGLFSETEAGTRMEGFIGVDAVPTGFVNGDFNFKMHMPQMEVYYRNIGREGDLRNVIDLLLDMLIKFGGDPQNRSGFGISLFPVSPGSRSFVDRREFIPDDKFREWTMPAEKMQQYFIDRHLQDRFNDQAQDAGGIDLDPAGMDLKIQDAGGPVDLGIDAAMLERFEEASGLSPVIVGAWPLDDLSQFLGLKHTKF